MFAAMLVVALGFWRSGWAKRVVALEAGDTLDEFLRQFPSVTREQAIAALELARNTLLTSGRSAW